MEKRFMNIKLMYELFVILSKYKNISKELRVGVTAIKKSKVWMHLKNNTIARQLDKLYNLSCI